MACLRNLVIGVLCRAGPVNVAAALRRHARDPRRPLATLGIRFVSDRQNRDLCRGPAGLLGAGHRVPCPP
jgi:hypothetical protein